MHPPVFAVLLTLVLAEAAPLHSAQAQAQHPRRAIEDTVVRQGQQFDVTRFDSVTAVTLRAILDSVAAKGLPTAKLLNRALEGAARRAPGSRIIAVVRAHAAAMEDARGLLGSRPTEAELDAAATAMRIGVDRPTVCLLHSARPGNTIIKPLVILTDLLLRGIPPATANNAVLTIARMPGSDGSLDAMQSLVAKNESRGGSALAVDALQRYLRDKTATYGQDASSGSATREPDC